jgi:exodeoxyribonuclease VII large subunit
MTVHLPSLNIRREGVRLFLSYGYCQAGNAAVKQCGFRWHPESRSWMRGIEDARALLRALDAAGLAQVVTWLREQPETSIDAVADVQAPGGEPHGTTKVGADALGVSAFVQQVRSALVGAFRAPVWVEGRTMNLERATVRVAAWGVFFQLCEQDAATGRTVQLTVRASRVAWARAEAQLRAVGVEPCDDLPLRVRGSVDLGAARSEIQLVLESVDPAWSLGVFAQRRAQVLSALASEGLLRTNRELPLPRVPLRVALVTAASSDAARDVLSKLQASFWAFRVRVFDVRVQGPQLRPSVLRALRDVREHSADFDVCVVVRGGGSRAELADWDDLEVARAVATLPIRVLVGIGHDRDQSVLDEIAWSRRTPTDAAVALLERLEEVWAALDGFVRRLGSSVQARVEHEERALGRSAATVRLALRETERRERVRVVHLDGRVRRAVHARWEAENARQRGWAPSRIRARVLASWQRRQNEIAACAQAMRDATDRSDERHRARHAAYLVRVQRAARGRALEDAHARVERARAWIERRSRAALGDASRSLDANARLLHVADPLRPLRLGFALVVHPDGRRVVASDPLGPGDELRLSWLDRLVDVTVHGVVPLQGHEVARATTAKDPREEE